MVVPTFQSFTVKYSFVRVPTLEYDRFKCYKFLFLNSVVPTH
ncbi:hypothetical protein LEP1GSC083_4884 [Leptospira interrogans serovar Pyrogenes str. L0374]|uniref:Uncharacterized protein n=1 Tax=Leptospira interrogans serovar Pyrogenes str. L0374 TaxID=1049928 RepID=M6K2B1_LEPIR|nr:hypothetical protein LEP1GSC083_4884 [Leptospira interrogans serovar Pyrogenes str. L0374]